MQATSRRQEISGKDSKTSQIIDVAEDFKQELVITTSSGSEDEVEMDPTIDSSHPWVPVWAQRAIIVSPTGNRWAAVDELHPPLLKAIVRVSKAFRSDENNDTRFNEDMLYYIVHVDDDGDILLYSPTWRRSAKDHGRWVMRHKFHNLELLVSAEVGEQSDNNSISE